MTNYHPIEIEEKWLKAWEGKELNRVVDFGDKPKYYALVEFPYPSGDGLHIGHAFTNTVLDVLARQKRMAGWNVLHPMGWDAFGLPTENSAIKLGIPPAKLTARNTARFKEQDKRLGLSYDWSREIDTTDPSYYKWTQWIFIQLFKHGLAYKEETPVGWCPSCKIILANEEIVAGKCERCGHEVEYRRQAQWLLRITAYADRLADELDEVDYPEYVKKSQRDWIGRTQGVQIAYPVVDEAGKPGEVKEISCYSTRPDTNFGATFVVIAPEHPLVEKLTTTENQEAVSKYVKQAKKKSELERAELAKDKSGVFTGAYAVNRLTGRKMPIWVADFVILSAGTGIVVGVPAHDERDWDFARKYGLEIVPVVKPESGEEWSFDNEPFLDIDKAEVFNSDFLDGLPALEAKEKIIDYLVEKGWGRRAKNYHLRDWVFSRQHYWGEPIPMVYCPACAKKAETALIVNFYKQETWDQLVVGKKTVETRALNPEEPERYFGNVKEGDYLRAVNKELGEERYFVVRNTMQFKKLADLWAERKLVSKIFPADTPKSGAALVEAYRNLAPNYLEKIEKNGLVAWEVESATPGWIPVSDEDLPVRLPDVEKYEPTDTGESPLAKMTDWVTTKCPECGGPARRETDTMPNWAGSSWYYLAFCMAEQLRNQKSKIKNQSDKSKLKNCGTPGGSKLRPEVTASESESVSPGVNNIFEENKDVLAYWLPVDLYMGGAEHTTLHLLYSRFWHKFLNDIGAVPGREPYAARRQHGVILGEDGARMSKSRGNVINPDQGVAKFGADTLRVYLMFMGPYDATMPWSTKGLEGAYRFLSRVWRLVERELEASSHPRIITPGVLNHPRGDRMGSPGVGEEAGGEGRHLGGEKTRQLSLTSTLHKTVKKVTEDIGQLKHNTAIAALMEFVNEWSAKQQSGKDTKFQSDLSFEELGIFVKLLAPFAPFMAEELWQKLRVSQEGRVPPCLPCLPAGRRVPRGETDKKARDTRGTPDSRDTFVSVHLQPWPEYDPELVKEDVVTVIIQINGKTRGQILIESKRAREQESVEEAARKEPNVAKHLEGKSVKKVIFVPGRLINFVV